MKDEWTCPGCGVSVEPSDVRRHTQECPHVDGAGQPLGDTSWVEAAVRLWEEPPPENTLLVQRPGFDGPANGVPVIDRVAYGAWVLAWVYVDGTEVNTNG